MFSVLFVFFWFTIFFVEFKKIHLFDEKMWGLQMEKMKHCPWRQSSETKAHMNLPGENSTPILFSGVFIWSVWPIGHYSSLRHFSCQCFLSLRIKLSPSSWQWLFHHPSKLISFSLYWFIVCIWHHSLTDLYKIIFCLFPVLF